MASPASPVALTLRAVGGRTSAEVARAFRVPEAAMTQRITRAKQAIRDSGVPSRMPSGLQCARSLAVVLPVCHLVCTEGRASTAGSALHRTELATEAIRLARLVHGLRPDDAGVTGLLALRLLTDARRPARTGPPGELISMADQDRVVLGRGPDRRGRGAHHQGAGHRTGRSVPAPRGDRRRP